MLAQRRRDRRSRRAGRGASPRRRLAQSVLELVGEKGAEPFHRITGRDLEGPLRARCAALRAFTSRRITIPVATGRAGRALLGQTDASAIVDADHLDVHFGGDRETTLEIGPPIIPVARTAAVRTRELGSANAVASNCARFGMAVSPRIRAPLLRTPKSECRIDASKTSRQSPPPER